jgi:hypothetical protein
MITPTPGAHHGVPFKDYLSWDAVSVHDLMLVRRSPAHLREARLKPKEPTANMRFGTAAHAWILLETQEAAKELIVCPKVDRRTKAGKAQYAEFEAEAGDRIIVSQEEADQLCRMKAAVHDSAAARNLLLEAADREVSCCWDSASQPGMLCRGRPDAMSRKLIVDLKTSFDASPKEFARTAANFKYHAQAAYYLDGLKRIGEVDEDAMFAFLVVEKLPPYGVACYVLDEDAMQAGREFYMNGLATYAECRTSNHWRSYTSSDKVETLSLPRWSLES